MQQGIRAFRPVIAPIGMPRQSSAVGVPLSSNVFQPLAIMLLVAVIGLLAMSRFGHWQIGNEQMALDQLQSVHTSVATENSRLLKELATIESKKRMEAVAAVRLGLYPMKKSQLHNL